MCVRSLCVCVSSAYLLGYNERVFSNGDLAKRGHLKEQRCGVKGGNRRGKRERGRERKRGSE